MISLAIDTATRTAGMAILKDESILVESFFQVAKTASETLLPAIERGLDTAGLRMDEVDLFSLTIGPGSFTGLRVGASIVKGFGLATGKPVCGVSTLEALALNMAWSRLRVCPLLDAKKNQVYTALYGPDTPGSLKCLEPEQAADPEDFFKRIPGETVFLGDGAAVYGGLIRRLLPERCFFAPAHLQYIRPATVGIIGLARYRQGRTLDLATFVPGYLRKSEAEIKSGDRP